VTEQVPDDDLVVLDSDPDDRHLRAAVRVDRDQMCERRRLDQLPHGIKRRTHAPPV